MSAPNNSLFLSLLGITHTVNMLILNKTAGVFFKPSRRKIYEFVGSFHFHPGKLFLHKLVLGIETSCDDTAAAVVDEAGNVLGEAIHSQTEVHLKWVSIILAVSNFFWKIKWNKILIYYI